MAIDAKHLNLFTPQLIQHRNFVTLNNQVKGDNMYGSEPMSNYPMLMPTFQTNYTSVYNPAVCEAKTSVNTDSGLTYNIPAASRKRSRESMNQLYCAAPSNLHVSQKNNNSGGSQLPSFLGDDFLPQFQQHQFEIDAIISQHTKKIRLEIVERQKQQERLVAAAIGENVMKKLKEKEEQIQRMSKINLALQERVKSLFMENHLWRDLAQSNEATANSLRSNLEQVLAHVGGQEDRISPVEEDAESCCGSSDHGREGEAAIESKERDNRCKSCGERESCVLLLPCRHLCLCSGCGSGSQLLQSCPVCNESMNATLHVNMS